MTENKVVFKMEYLKRAFMVTGCLPIPKTFVTTTPPSAHFVSFPHIPETPPWVLAEQEQCLNGNYHIRDSWATIVLGDLHLEDDMSVHNQARGECLYALKELSLLPSWSDHVADNGKYSPPTAVPTIREILLNIQHVAARDLTASQLEMFLAQKRDGEFLQSCLVSLGDLGRKEIRHEPGDAGTTKSFQDAKFFLDDFGVPYEILSGNHDLEGLDEFDTDRANLQAWMNCFDKPTPQFCRQIGEKTLLLGLSTVRFRDAPHSSHEVHVDDEQLNWFQSTVRAHPANEGWKILVFSHAPIMGSGLRALHDVHVKNGCAWLNHCSENRAVFIRCVRENPQIKLWFSGHFHLSHEFEDSISTLASCTFVQVGVIGPSSTRDGRRQTRIVRGCKNRLEVYSVNHHERDEKGRPNIRLDVEIDMESDNATHKVHPTHDVRDENWVQAYSPSTDDEYYIESPNGMVADLASDAAKLCWWHMNDGFVLGLQQGQIVEYDPDTLCPLGVVITREVLGGRKVYVVDSGRTLFLSCNGKKQIEVVHPNADGSYRRNFQGNKRIRQQERAREDAARLWLETRQSG